MKNISYALLFSFALLTASETVLSSAHEGYISTHSIHEPTTNKGGSSRERQERRAAAEKSAAEQSQQAEAEVAIFN